MSKNKTLVDAETLQGALEALTNMDTAWEHLTCREADALARLVAESGKPSDAAQMLVFHVESDDHGDAHAEIKYANADKAGDGPDYERPVERDADGRERAAREYVAGLL